MKQSCVWIKSELVVKVHSDHGCAQMWKTLLVRSRVGKSISLLRPSFVMCFWSRAVDSIWPFNPGASSWCDGDNISSRGFWWWFFVYIKIWFFVCIRYMFCSAKGLGFCICSLGLCESGINTVLLLCVAFNFLTTNHCCIWIKNELVVKVHSYLKLLL